ncbi:ISL3 family transposase [Microvirga sp. G4-2]|uniref:ISL3 family transposase n=1 Tax=Microvirga sp. G4-2 TaxID=3434467 RepID=UPI0040443C9D
MVNALYLDDWTVEKLHKTKNGYRLEARYDVEPSHCPKCGSIRKPYGHGPRVIEYVDAPVHGWRTVVDVEVQRYRCRDCGGTFMQPLPDMDPKRQMTRRCVEHIKEQGLLRPYTQLAREIGVTEKTVRDICNEEIDRLLASHQPYAPVILGIDELTLLHKKRTIFTDVGERRVIDLMDGMNRSQVDRWLYTLPNRKRIQLVTMDMWGPYREAVRAILPEAIIVADRWHIQKKVNELLDVIRNRQRRAAKGKARKNPWKARRLIQARGKNLSPQRALLLDGMLKNNDLLSAAWHTKEAFYDIWDAANRSEAEALFDHWKANLPSEVQGDFGALAKTVENWREEVFVYFDHRYTNAYTESANGLIKIVNRAGRGYRFEAIRAKALTMPRLNEKRWMVCESCLGQFPVSTDHFLPAAHLEGLAMSHPPQNGFVICWRCNQFHTDEWFTHHAKSTPKSE